MEGLRAVAVLAVVLFHAEVPGLGGGYVGVDVFFVISGFLITGLLWREASSTGTVRLRSFYGARARRLLPASAAVGVVTMVGSAILLPPLQARLAISDGIASALYVSNYQFVLRGVDYFANNVTPSPFLHYWSLGVEEQFYLVWAPMLLGTVWLIRLVRRARGRPQPRAVASRRPFIALLAVVALVSFVLSYLATYIVPAAAFYSLPTRAWQLAIGGLVALTAIGWQRLSPRIAAVVGWTGLGMILLACVWLSPTTLYPGTAALLPTVGTALLIGAGCATADHGAGRLLGLSPMRAIGRISYSWYLWHWPVLILAPFLLGHPLGLAARLGVAALSAVLAWLTMRYLENPLRFAPKIRSSAWRSLGLGAVATVIAVCVGLGLMRVMPTPVGHGAPATPLAFAAFPVPSGAPMGAYDTAVHQTFAEVEAAVAASARMKAVPSNLTPPLEQAYAEKAQLSFGGCLREPFESGQPECAMGDTSSSTTVALVGDSHAAMWTPAFQEVAAQRRWRLEMLAKGACPLLDLPITNPLSRLAEHFEHCAQWRVQILNRLESERPRLIVLSLWRGYGTAESLSGYRAYDTAWIDSFTKLVARLRATGAQVLTLGPIPDPHIHVPVCLSGYLDDVSACTPARSAAVNESGIAAEAAATEAGGGQYVDTTDLFCTKESCPVIVGNTLVYIDQDHMALEYARALAPVMAALADRALAHT
ncbi:acyltransferase family protein [Mycobacterium sp. CVI_P3]|uniref:Acyltransferase family protein n=1 Tax=Mycobacterium pinniadriaticum TaxID=2994102 RepID=A0ABT3SKE9_9MYCO|nr:acyltransferase family protein [Mycobacterium pinniadriaticum]MCX2933573.1 acyltransferase family protein [Mycobacterium pinniadriaticum]MCX2939995.1 acyltransferase family protein [Mycobacterium pinniadriaticum]